ALARPARKSATAAPAPPPPPAPRPPPRPAPRRASMGDSSSPISVILVSSGSRGNKLLFRYPFQRGRERRASQTSRPRSRHAVSSSSSERDSEQDGDARFSDVVLATILATKSEMCGQKFELKIDDVRFVGHPTLLQHGPGQPAPPQVPKTDPAPRREAPTMTLFNVVFALRALADPAVAGRLHTLSRRIATALQHEERRCQYLTREAKLILALQDELAAGADGEEPGALRRPGAAGPPAWPSRRRRVQAPRADRPVCAAGEGPTPPFQHILPKCKLARDLKEAYDSLCSSGVVRLHVNSWLEVSFCLPHQTHRGTAGLVPPEAIERSLKAIRPYHALLLLSDEKALLAELPLDCSPALVRVVKTASAVKNLQQLAQDADLALLQVFQLAAHLVYWGRAIVVYPLCENNVYVLSPHASPCLYSPLAEQFSRRFPSHDLPSVLSRFSLPVSLSEFRSPLAPPVQETQLIQVVVWLLQRRLLVQLHTYVRLMAPPSQAPARVREDEAPFPARGGGRSLSTPSALSFGSPTSSDDMTLTSPSMDNSSAELLPSGDSPLDKRMTESLLASLAEHERAAILSVPAAQNPEDLRMFARCGQLGRPWLPPGPPSCGRYSPARGRAGQAAERLPGRLLHYFRGRHHLEEIMYHENARRSQLLALCDKFRAVLVVAAHEDPVIAVFQALLP
ncbi:GATOR complex protein NPRL3, partial [Galemys pyrenaicus]